MSSDVRFKSDYKMVKVRFADILYIEGLREYISIHVPNKRIVILESMRHMEELLPANQFVRVHKSFIVAINKVDAISGNKLELADKSIPIGKNYKKDVMKVFLEVNS